MGKEDYHTEPREHHYRRRSFAHDYRRPSRYMITFFKSNTQPPLSIISGTPEAPEVKLTSTGEHFQLALEQWQEEHKEILVDRYVVMPDHIHICMSVLRYIPTGLGRALALLKGKATGCNGGVEFFDKGYNDSIAYNDEQYARQLSYVGDNPRRLLIKRKYPNLFRQRYSLSNGEIELQALGNVFLLKQPHLEVVRFSRQYSLEEVRQNMERWDECIRNGGVLISPFIHPVEKEALHKALENDGNIIRICTNGFAERFAPIGKEFDLMSRGRLLLLGPKEYSFRKEALCYSYAQYLNHIALLLVQQPDRFRLK